MPILNDSFQFSDHFRSVKGTDIPYLVVFTEGSETPRISSEISSMVGQLRIADFNEDNLDDIVVTYGDSLSRPLFYFSNGDGTFTFKNIAPEGSERRYIRNDVAIDLNQDGFIDYVGFTAPHGKYEGTLGSRWDNSEPDLILVNQSGSGFKLVTGLDETYHHGGAVGDLNNDGTLDVFGIAEFPRGSLTDKRSPLLQSKDGAFVKSTDFLSGYFSNLMISDMRLADLNKDGLTDYIFTIAPEKTSSSKITPLESSATGTVAYAYGQPNVTMDFLDWKIIGKHWMDNSTWLAFLENNNRNSPSQTDFSAGPSNIEVIDVNNDGLLDILVGLYVSAPSWKTSGFSYLENTGIGFTDKTDQAFPNQLANRDISSPTDFIFGFAMADLDSDGARDLVISQKSYDRVGSDSKGSISVFINNHGVFEPVRSSNLDFSYQGRFGLALAGIGDFNGDGAPDLASVLEVSSKKNMIVTSLNVNPGFKSKAGETFGSYRDDNIHDPESTTFRGFAGDDEISAGHGGTHYAVYYGSKTGFEIKHLFDNRWSVKDKQGNEGDDTLEGIERLRFADVNLALDVGGVGGMAYRIYKAAFNRTPDNGGLGYWIAQMDKGMDVVTVAARFIDSPEFRSLYGMNPTDAEFLTKVYSNVLDRAPDSSGLAWWVNEMKTNPTKTWEKVLADFSESAENKANVASLIADGIPYESWVG